MGARSTSSRAHPPQHQMHVDGCSSLFPSAANLVEGEIPAGPVCPIHMHFAKSFLTPDVSVRVIADLICSLIAAGKLGGVVPG